MLIGYGEENGTKYWNLRDSNGPNEADQGCFRLYRHDDEQHYCVPKSNDKNITMCGTCGVLVKALYPLFWSDMRAESESHTIHAA